MALNSTQSSKTTRGLVLAGLALLYTSASVVHSAEVIGRSPDNTSGRMLGGWSAFLVGGAAAGPAGAIAGGLIGIWIGDNAQEMSGLSGNSYQVKRDDGDTQTLRSPRKIFVIGEQVRIKGDRLVPLTDKNTKSQH